MAWTLAANFDFDDNLGIYGRYSDGYVFPHFDDIRESNDQINSVQQLEAGVKYTNDWLELYSTAFFNQYDAFSSTVGAVTPAEAFETESLGIEADGTLFIGDEFSVNFLLTLQNAEITDSTTTANIGNTVLRQPDFQARIAPSYAFRVGQFDATVYGAVTLVGDRYSGNSNTVELSSFEKIDLGVIRPRRMDVLYSARRGASVSATTSETRIARRSMARPPRGGRALSLLKRSPACAVIVVGRR